MTKQKKLKRTFSILFGEQTGGKNREGSSGGIFVAHLAVTFVTAYSGFSDTPPVLSGSVYTQSVPAPRET